VRQNPPFQYAELSLEIGTGHSNLGKIKSRAWSLNELANKLRKPVRDNITFAEYLALPTKEQDKRKNHGFWLGGPSTDGRRRLASIKYRSVITLDLDDVTSELYEAIRGERTRLNKYCFIVHSTRKHTPEKPRLRIVIFLTEPCSIDKYGPASRIVASFVDPTMDHVDDVSHRPAQMMFFPSASSDGEFVFFQNEGELLDVDTVLAEFGDWQDFTKLPFSTKQGRKRPADPNRKAEHPHTKRGIVGAFCRTYSIEDAIDTFLSDVYAPGDAQSGKPRYTYVAGTTANGAVVKDDGLFLYSHHTSDPVTDRLVNAFDLVRIHLFGDQDDGVDEQTSPGSMPSFKAMVGFCENLDGVAAELRQEQYDIAAMFEDLGSEDTQKRVESEPETEPDLASQFPNLDDDDDDLIGVPGETKAAVKYDSPWMEKLEINKKDGTIKNHLPNYSLILQNDSRIAGAIQFNLFTQEIVTRKGVRARLDFADGYQVDDPINGDLWTDKHTNIIRGILEAPNGKGKSGYGLRVSDRDLDAAIDLTASKNAFHPVREYFESLTWDGIERISTMFQTWLGTPDSAYAREVSTKTMMAVVTRIMEPGHKFDFIPIFEGAQGKRKSTFVRLLAKGWFCELQGDFHDRKRLVETIQGKMIAEIPELAAFTRSDVNDLKACAAANEDRVRMSYGRRAREFKRQCVFMGTTNDLEYLNDISGGRRFWPILVLISVIDTQGFTKIVDQLWAEAFHGYREARKLRPKGALPLYIEGTEAQSYALEHQESRRIQTEADAFAGIIGAWLDEPVPRSLLDGVDASFQKLDGGSEETVLRDQISLIEIWVSRLRKDEASYGRKEANMLGRAMRLVGGWALNGSYRKSRFGKQKKWIREVK
jgi:predicted P-loop ATPase